MTVRCIERIQKGGITFRPGDTYYASEVNEHWYAVDVIGFETDDFHLHFEVIEGELTEEDASARMEQKSHQTMVVNMSEPEIPIVPGLWDDDEDDEAEDEETFFDRLMNYIFLIR